jgi:hypothetical protein
MITEKEYLKMKKLIAEYETKQLNKHAVIQRSEQFCYCGSKIKITCENNRCFKECENGHEQ